MEKLEIKKVVLDHAKQNKVVVRSMDGLLSTPIDDFILQNADGILYDLNRTEAVVLTFIDDPKWVNDYAVALTIRALKARIEALESGSEVKDIAIAFYCDRLNTTPDNTIFDVEEQRFMPITELFEKFITNYYK